MKIAQKVHIEACDRAEVLIQNNKIVLIYLKAKADTLWTRTYVESNLISKKLQNYKKTIFNFSAIVNQNLQHRQRNATCAKLATIKKKRYYDFALARHLLRYSHARAYLRTHTGVWFYFFFFGWEHTKCLQFLSPRCPTRMQLSAIQNKFYHFRPATKLKAQKTSKIAINETAQLGDALYSGGLCSYTLKIN